MANQPSNTVFDRRFGQASLDYVVEDASARGSLLEGRQRDTRASWRDFEPAAEPLRPRTSPDAFPFCPAVEEQSVAKRRPGHRSSICRWNPLAAHAKSRHAWTEAGDRLEPPPVLSWRFFRMPRNATCTPFAQIILPDGDGSMNSRSCPTHYDLGVSA